MELTYTLRVSVSMDTLKGRRSHVWLRSHKFMAHDQGGRLGIISSVYTALTVWEKNIKSNETDVNSARPPSAADYGLPTAAEGER